MDAASLSALYKACGLFALTDALAEQVDADGYAVPGSQGQPTAHPLLSEVRLNRVQALGAKAPATVPTPASQAINVTRTRTHALARLPSPTRSA